MGAGGSRACRTNRSGTRRRCSGACEMLANSLIALRCLSLRQMPTATVRPACRSLGGNSTLADEHEAQEGKEGKNAFLEKRKLDFRKFKRLP